MTKMVNIKKLKLTIVLIFFIFSLAINLILFLYLFINSNYFRDLFGYSKEISRINSPDRVVDAVLIRSNMGGATSGFSYQVYIVPTGENPKGDDYVFTANHVDSLAMDWKKIKFLEIHYKNARVFKFTNFWLSKDIQDYRYIVEIRLRPFDEFWSLRESDRIPIY